MHTKTFLAILLALVLSLAACSKSPKDGEPRADRATAKLSAYNHTPDYIHQYYVDGQGGGNSRAYGGGGSFTCCIIYPRQWREGLAATVRWTTSSSDPKATGEAATEKWHEKTVPIDRYTDTGTTLNVHFLPDGDVRLVITNMSAGHPDYPGPVAPEKPPGYPVLIATRRTSGTKHPSEPMHTKTFLAILLALVLSLAACSKSPKDGEPRADQATANLSAYNHTPDYIHRYYVDGQGGSNSYAYGGGGKFACCIIYPRQWREGLAATVRWTTSSSDPNATGDDAIGKWHEKTVPIDRYTETGTTLNVHFLPDGDVRLVITNMSAGHPDYPGPVAPEKPPGYPY